MIYWPISAEALDIYIPNASGYIPADGEPAPRLEVRSNVNLNTVTLDWEPDGVTPLYFFRRIQGWTLPEGMAAGEYTYTLRLGEDGKVLSEGLLIVGDYAVPREQYEKTIQYEQYGNETRHDQPKVL